MELVNKLQHQEKLATEIRHISNLHTLAEKMDSEELYEKYCEERDEFIDKLFIENPIKVTVESTQTFFLDNRFVDTDDLFYNMSEGITFKEYMTSVIESVIDEYEDVKEGKKDSVVTVTNEDMGIYVTNNPSYGLNC